jgi:hypothetical protein
MPNRKEYRLILDDAEEWHKFLALCQLERSSAAKKLREYIAQEAKRLDRMMKK